MKRGLTIEQHERANQLFKEIEQREAELLNLIDGFISDSLVNWARSGFPKDTVFRLRAVLARQCEDHPASPYSRDITQ